MRSSWALGAVVFAAWALLASPAHAARVIDEQSPRTRAAEGPPTQSSAGAEGASEARRARGKTDKEAIGRDPFKSLGGDSPFCRRAMSGRGAQNCKRSGALSRPHPIGNYNYDIHINTGVSRIKSNLMMGIQVIVSFVWLAFLYIVAGVLLLLEWTFSLDPIGAAMGDVKRSLGVLHRDVFGQPWFLFAVLVAGLWGIYNGLVRRRTIQTLGGLAITVALMCIALVLIANPKQTVGRASHEVNEASVSLLSSASTGTVNKDANGFGAAMSGVFDSIVLRPWCALEFGDVDFCFQRPPADVPYELKAAARASPTVGDLWLRFPAGGEERNKIYEHWKQDGKPTQPYVRMQKQGATGLRFVLVCVIAIGLLGACALLGWLGVRLLTAGVIALVLILFAPIMLIAAAFGESGRATFIAWGKRLIGALVAKLIYALMLAIVLLVAGFIAEMKSLGWIGVWLVQIAFWWGLFLKRDEIVGWLSVGGLRGAVHPGENAMSTYAKLRTAQWGLGALKERIAGAGDRGRRGAEKVGGTLAERSALRHEATRAAATDTLGERAEGVLAGKLDDARITLAKNQDIDQELRHANRFLGPFDRDVILANAKGTPPPRPSENQKAMLDKRSQLEAAKDAPETMRQAQTLVGRADRNLALTGKEFSAPDTRAQIAQRQRELDQGLPANHPQNLRWAGIDPERFKRAAPADKAQMEQQVKEAIERDRKLVKMVPSDERSEPTPSEAKDARSELRPVMPEHVRHERDVRRSERQKRRTREHLYRRR